MAVVADFGLSITFTKDELMKTHCGSPEYAAPELFAAQDRKKWGRKRGGGRGGWREDGREIEEKEEIDLAMIFDAQSSVKP